MKKICVVLSFLLLIFGSNSSIFGQISVTIPDTTLESGSTALIPVNIDEITEADRQVFSFQFTLKYDESVLNISGVENSGTISEPWASNTIINPRGSGEVDIGAFGIFNNILGKGVLIYLEAEIIGGHADSSNLELQNFLFNAGDPQSITMDGKVRVVSPLVSVSFIANIQESIIIFVDGQEKTTPFDTTWHSGFEHTIGVLTLQNFSSESRALFDSWSDAGDTSHTVSPISDTVFSCNMRWEHFLTLASEHGTAQGAGWYSQGDTVEIAVDSLVNLGDTTRYVFAGWEGTGQGSYTGEKPRTNVIMNEPIYEDAQWVTQHLVTLESLYGNPVGAGWRVEGDTVEIQIDSLEYVNDQTRYVFNSWEGYGNGSYSGALLSVDIIVNNPILESAIWDKQFYLSVFATPEDLTTFSETGWYFENEPGIELNAPEMIAATEVKYRFVNWLIDGEINDQNPIVVQMDTTHIYNAVYQLDSVLVEIDIDVDNGFAIYVDSLSYETPYSNFWEYQSEHMVGIDSILVLTDSLSRYVFDSWSDDGDVFHSVSADSAIKLVASITPQHYLHVETKPAGLMEFEQTGWHVEGDSVQLSEAFQQIFTEADTFQFNTWLVDSIPVAGNPIALKMNTHHHAVANYENLYFIAGKVTDSRGLPVQGAELVLSGTVEDTTYSKETGDYFFSLLPQGNYQVNPHFENFEFTPPFWEYDPLQSSQTEQNFLAIDIIDPTVQLLHPNGGQWLKKSTLDTITWAAYDNVGIDSIAIELAVDGGINWWTIAEIDSGNVQQFVWLTPDTISQECLIRVHVFDFDNNNALDESDSMFTIGSAVGVTERFETFSTPTEFTVEQNYPNPFNNSTTIVFQLPKEGFVSADILNLNGQRVKTLRAKNYKAGTHRLTWNGKDHNGKVLSTGVYLFRIEAFERTVIKKLLYVR